MEGLDELLFLGTFIYHLLDPQFDFNGPLSESLDWARDQMEKFFVIFIIIVINHVDVKLGIFHLEMLDYVQIIQLTNKIDFLCRVHALWNHGLNAIEGPIFERLRHIFLLQNSHTALNDTFKILKLIPVDQLGKNIEYIFDWIMIKLCVILEYDLVQALHDCLNAMSSDTILDPGAQLHLILVFSVTPLDKLLIESYHGLDDEFQDLHLILRVRTFIIHQIK